MQDNFGYWAQSLGEAFVSSPLGASELIVGLMVGATFIAFAANSLVPHRGQVWDRHETSGS